jgi:TetR/AcrR family transcriptional repressor of nem operon
VCSEYPARAREPTTRRGKDTKRRIVAAAAELMYDRGVDTTSLDDILAASGAGKSQLYHYFAGKDELVAEVLRHQLDQVLQEQNLFQLDTWDGIRAWFEALVTMQQTQRGFRGCPLGSIAGDVLDQDERLRRRAADAFARWETSLAAALQAMRDRGLLAQNADPPILAETTIAIMQGGYLLASTKRDVRPMRLALSAALAHLKSFASPPAGEGHSGNSRAAT